MSSLQPADPVMSPTGYTLPPVAPEDWHAPEDIAEAVGWDVPLPTYEDLALYQFTVEQYDRLCECEIFDPRERVFLLDGLLARKMSKNPPHIIATENLTLLLVRATPDGWFPSSQNSVVMKPRSEPEPDMKIVRGCPGDYRRKKPTPADVALVIEVSEITLRLDQTTMKRRYAASGIAIYWIVNLVANRIEVYTEPTGPDPSPDYRSRVDYGPDDAVPFVIEGREIARIPVRAILPPALDA